MSNTDSLKVLKKSVNDIKGNYPDDLTKYFIDAIAKKNASVIEKLSDIKEELPYKSNSKIKKFSSHIGQRKLLMNEIQFLTKIKSSKKQQYCVYAGSAPGHKTYYLSTLFPDIKFILVDPNEFNLMINIKTSHRSQKHKDIVHMSSGYPTKSNTMSFTIDGIRDSNYRIFILEEYMTNELAKKFKELNPYFISDIRSNLFNLDYPTDFDLYFNSAMMFNWICTMRPRLAMLKIRMPYETDGKDETVKKKIEDIKKEKYIQEEFKIAEKNGIDFLSDYTLGKFRYSKSDIYIQPWQPQSSEELRMYIKKNNILDIIEYSISQIENKMFYYNSIDRMWVHHKNPNASKQLNFCHCNDCSLENKIWKDYGYNKKQIYTVVKHIGNILNRPLKRSHKFTIFEPFIPNEMVKRIFLWKDPYRKRNFGNQKGNKGKEKSKYQTPNAKIHVRSRLFTGIK
jgi:hypothetical protein